MRLSRSTVIDGAIAGLLLVLGVWEALAQPDDPGPPRWTVPFAAVAAIALLWRRRWPVAVLCLVVAVGVGPHVAANAEPAFYGFLLPYVVAAYTAAAQLDQRRSLVVPAAGVVVVAALALRGEEFHSVNSLAIAVLATAVAYGVGRVTAVARAHAAQSAATADLLSREQDLRAREAVAAERDRVARELHDAIAHDVSIMVIQATAAERVLDTDVVQARASLRAVQETGRRTIDELYLMLGALRGEDDSDSGPAPGLPDLPDLVARVRAAGVDVDLVMPDEPGEVPAAVGLSAYRVVQECLTNVVKHARGARATVRVETSDTAVTVHVEDDGGHGPSSADAPGLGSGLAGIRERVGIFGGCVQTGPRDGGGFEVRAALPLTVGSR